MLHRRESGYLSQAQSSELLRQDTGTILETSAVEVHEGSTPGSSPAKASPSSSSFSSSPSANPSRLVVPKEKVTCELLEVIKNDLDDPDLPAEEIAHTNVFTLGLDSLSLMEVRDFILRDYGFDFGISELTELETIAAMAELVERESLMEGKEDGETSGAMDRVMVHEAEIEKLKAVTVVK